MHQAIRQYIKQNPMPKICWEYREELSSEDIGKLLTDKKHATKIENELYEYNLDHIFEEINSYVKEAAEALSMSEHDIEDYVCVDMNLKDLIKNTRPIPVRVTLFSNYDCYNSFITEHDYDGLMKQMVDALNLNPARLAPHIAAIEPDFWPDKSERDGNEYVRYEDFATEVFNNTTCSLLTFCGLIKLDLDKLPIKKFIIPKGNPCGLFGSFHGGGSVFDMRLIRDMEIDLSWHGETKGYDCFGLVMDTDREQGYGICDVYGTDESFFGKELVIL
jgi:hypothetical protein